MGRLHLKFHLDLSSIQRIREESVELLSLVIDQVNMRMQQGPVLLGKSGVRAHPPLLQLLKRLKCCHD